MIDLENYTDYSIAEAYVCAIEYGDLSGDYDENELDEINHFIELVGNKTIEWLDLDSPNFEEDYISGLMANCVTCRVYENKEGKN